MNIRLIMRIIAGILAVPCIYKNLVILGMWSGIIEAEQHEEDFGFRPRMMAMSALLYIAVFG